MFNLDFNFEITTQDMIHVLFTNLGFQVTAIKTPYKKSMWKFVEVMQAAAI